MVWTERQEAELKILRFSLGVVRLGMIRNYCIRGAAEDGQFEDWVSEAILRWSG